MGLDKILDGTLETSWQDFLIGLLPDLVIVFVIAVSSRSKPNHTVLFRKECQGREVPY
jgi:hypothetical protein